MSNVIKFPSKKSGMRVKIVDDFELERLELATQQPIKEMIHRDELERKTKEAFENGWMACKSELEENYTKRLVDKWEVFNTILKAIEKNLITYEEAFDNVVIKTAISLAEKIIRIKVGDEDIIKQTLQESLKKVIQANDVIIRIHPTDYELLFNKKEEYHLGESFKNIKIEQDERIEQGGCFIETEIGNVDARLSSQLSEIQKALESILLPDILKKE